MKRFLPAILLTFFLFGNGLTQPTGYTYVKEITIQSNKVSGTLANFPVLISVTDNDLRTTANGGHVTNNNGYDILFTTDNCLTILSHQIESYTATSGRYIAWVKVPSISSSANTTIQMYYGNGSVNANPSITSTWDSNYKGVWHFNNSTTDNSPSGNNLTDNSTADFASGKIGNARDLNNSTDILSSNTSGRYLRLANGFFSGMTDFTFEGWVFLDRATTNWERIFDFGQSTSINFFLCPSIATGTSATTNARITTTGNAGEQGPISASATNTGSWIHWAVVLNSSTSSMTLYKNGAPLASANGTVALRPSNMEASTANYFGRSQYSADHYIDAQFDEFRISSSARSNGYILTAYNNQNDPSTFYTISSEGPAAALCTILPIELLSFDVAQSNNSVEILWTTLSESNNDYFTIERSTDGIHWEKIGNIPGGGSSKSKLNYKYTDRKLMVDRRYYYRLKQTDFNGNFAYSKIVSLDYSGTSSHNIYITSDKKLVIEGRDMLDTETTLYSITGSQIALSKYKTFPGKVIYDISDVAPGVYIIKLRYGDNLISKRIIVN